MRFTERGDTTLVERVTRAIRNAIIEGDLTPGSRLVDTELAQQLDTSRPTIRDAFRRLEHEGLLINLPYRGYFVAELRATQVFDLLELRGLLEGRSAETAVVYLSDKDFEQLASIADAIARQDFEFDVATIRELDINFHNIVVERSRKPILNEHWALLNARLSILNSLSRHLLKLDAVDTARRHHTYLRELRSRDPERARTAAEEHYAYYSERLRDAIGDQGDVVLTFGG